MMSEEKKKPDPKKYSEKERIDAMDSDNFDPVKYQKDGQGGPRKGLAADEEE